MLNKDEIKKIADLARIEISEEETDEYTTELSDILGFVKKLNEADTEDVEPIAHIATGASARGGSGSGGKNEMREDRIVEASEDTKKRIIGNFPEEKDRFDKIKAVF